MTYNCISTLCGLLWWIVSLELKPHLMFILFICYGLYFSIIWKFIQMHHETYLSVYIPFYRIYQLLTCTFPKIGDLNTSGINSGKRCISPNFFLQNLVFWKIIALYFARVGQIVIPIVYRRYSGPYPYSRCIFKPNYMLVALIWHGLINNIK